MLTVRKSQERGEKRLDWLDARYSFAFGDYYDPRFLGFGALRALNDYRLAPGAGFDPARRSDLEVLSYVVDGALAHSDSLGSTTTLPRGGLQRLTAGAGAEHAERNASDVEDLRFIHIWILPENRGAAHCYDIRACTDLELQDALRLIGSSDGRDGSLSLDRDVDLYASRLSAGAALSQPLGLEREAWLQIVKGSIKANGALLEEGDGAAIQDEEALTVESVADAELLLFDMARDG